MKTCVGTGEGDAPAPAPGKGEAEAAGTAAKGDSKLAGALTGAPPKVPNAPAPKDEDDGAAVEGAADPNAMSLLLEPKPKEGAEDAAGAALKPPTAEDDPKLESPPKGPARLAEDEGIMKPLDIEPVVLLAGAAPKLVENDGAAAGGAAEVTGAAAGAGLEKLPKLPKDELVSIAVDTGAAPNEKPAVSAGLSAPNEVAVDDDDDGQANASAVGAEAEAEAAAAVLVLVLVVAVEVEPQDRGASLALPKEGIEDVEVEVEAAAAGAEPKLEEGVLSKLKPVTAGAEALSEVEAVVTGELENAEVESAPVEKLKPPVKLEVEEEPAGVGSKENPEADEEEGALSEPKPKEEVVPNEDEDEDNKGAAAAGAASLEPEEAEELAPVSHDE